jgi:acyl-CoA synthetase (AMP-forming)/AMP-acid ligase II
VPLVFDEDQLGRARDVLASTLARRGLARGDRVAVLAGTCPEMVAAREALSTAGLMMVPLDPRLAAPEVAYVLAHARPALVLCQPERAAEIAAVAANDRLLPIRRPAIELLAPVATRPPAGVLPRPAPRPPSADAIGATLLYTSGTTGRAKGCVRTADQEAARAAELLATYSLGPEDVHLIACPLAYSAPGMLLRAGRAAGAATVLLPRFEAASFLAAVAAARATFFFLVPTQLQRLLSLPAELRAAADLGSVRAVVVAGAPMAAGLRRAAVDWLGDGRLWEFYGSSETGTVSVLRPEAQLAHPDSVGRPLPEVDIRVQHTADAPGEIFVRSPTVMAGYWNPVTGAVEWPGTDDRYLSVGDLGHLDARGYLHLVDRLHDTIISGGANVYPAEVERALCAHPEVDGAVVFGMADPEWGQRVVALVVRAAGSDISPDQLREHCRGHTAPHKVPKEIGFIAEDELPRTASGKPMRRAAAALARRAHRETDKTPLP